MRKFLLISVLLGSLALAQKNNQTKPSFERLKSAGVQMNSEQDAVPRRLSYQGLLTKANGRAVSDGTYQVTFKLFEQSEGGTAFWEETQSIGVSDGVISATLGIVNAITSVPANSYLEIAVDETTLSPRQEMTSVFYSVVSDTAKYSQGGSYLDLDDRPDLSIYAQKDTLSEYPKITSLDSVAFTGNYQDLSGRPDLSEVLESDTLNVYVMSDSLSSYTLTSNLSSVALSNDYADLDNLPDLSIYAPLDTLAVYVSSDTLQSFVSKDSVGTMASQNSDAVNITGGSVANITDLAIADGGTGASDNSTARQNLGLEIGVDIQGYDADLADLADGSLSAEKVQFLDNVTSDVQAQIDAIGDGPVNSLEDLGVTADSTELNFVDGVTSSIQDQLDAKQDLNSNLTTLAGLPQNHDHFLVSDGNSWTLEAGSDARGSLGLGTIATQAADNVDISGGRITDVVDIAIADGGTGASDITTARQNLGLEIGVDVQGYDADLTDLSDGSLSSTKVQYLENVSSDVQAQLNSKLDSSTVTLSKLSQADGNFIVSDGTNWTVENGSDARTSLGLGSVSTQDANNISITGGSVTGITDIAVADGGTGASDVSSARQNLGLEIGVDVQAYDADLADLADGTLSASKVENNEYFISSAGTSGKVWTSDGDGAGIWSDVAGITGAATTIATDDLAVSRALISNADGKVAISDVTSTELEALDGVTARVQTQLDAKQGASDNLTDITNLAHSDGNIIVSNGVRWTVEKDTEARSSLGLGSIATQSVDNVTITGGSISGVTDIAIADGGTGASDIATARQNLGLEVGVDVQAYDADLADLADGELSASKVQYGIDSEGTSGQVWTSDGDGVGVWGAPAGLTGAGSTIDSEDLAVSRAVVSSASGKIEVSDVTSTELSYLDGVTSAVQTQLDGKQGIDADLTAIAGLDNSDGNVIVGSAGGWVVESGATARTSLGLGTISTQASDNVAITGGSIDGTALGGTSASTGAFTSVTASTSLDVTGSTGVILENDETITNSTDGTVLINGIIAGGTGSAAGIFTSNGDQDVTLQTGNSTTGSITITDGANGNIAITPNGSGVVQLDGLSWPTADGSTDQVIKTDGSGTLSWSSAATSINGLSDALVETNSTYLGNDPSSTTNNALRNVAVGLIALDAITTGDNNVAVGYNSLTANTTGSDNMGVGYNALKANVGGTGNSAIGSGSLASNTGGNYNTAVGSNSLNDNDGGDRNVGIGNSSLRDNSSGNDNTAVGKSSGQLITTGDDNVTIGHESGILLTTGSKNVILGSDSDPSSDAAINQATIGYGVTGQADNSVTLGNADVTAVYMAQDQGATVYAAGIDITGSGGLILENDETITNSTDGTIVIDGKTDFNDNALTGYGADLQTESGTSKTLAASDNGTIIVCSSNSSITITVPASLPAGFNCMIIQNGSGQVSLSASSTTLNNRNGSKTAGQYAILTLVHLGSDVFVVSGDTTS